MEMFVSINSTHVCMLIRACISVTFFFRIETLTQLPREIVEGAESLQVSRDKLTIQHRIKQIKHFQAKSRKFWRFVIFLT